MLRWANFLACGVMIGLLVLIYQLKYETLRLEQRAAHLRAAIAQEKETLSVSRAEWSYLADPGRLEQLTAKRLGLKPVQSWQVAPLNALLGLEHFPAKSTPRTPLCAPKMQSNKSLEQRCNFNYPHAALKAPGQSDPSAGEGGATP